MRRKHAKNKQTKKQQQTNQKQKHLWHCPAAVWSTCAASAWSCRGSKNTLHKRPRRSAPAPENEATTCTFSLILRQARRGWRKKEGKRRREEEEKEKRSEEEKKGEEEGELITADLVVPHCWCSNHKTPFCGRLRRSSQLPHYVHRRYSPTSPLLDYSYTLHQWKQ